MEQHAAEHDRQLHSSLRERIHRRMDATRWHIPAILVIAVGAAMIYDGFLSLDSDLAEAITGILLAGGAICYLIYGRAA